MKKGRLLIITTTALMLSLSGFLIYQVLIDPFGSRNDKDSGTASAMAAPTGTAKPGYPEGTSGNDTYIPPTNEYDDNNGIEGGSGMNENHTPWTPATEMDLDPESITVFVNKEFVLPKDYVPKDMVIPNVLFDIEGYDERKLLREEAAYALERLFVAAKKDGHTLYGISGYRSYERQKQIFSNNILKKGKRHTLKYSAVPGASEHQTGLSMDVSSKSLRYRLITPFANSPEGEWLGENAHKYGFVIRYSKEKEDITGYAYEPWHIRYLGKDLATYLYTNDLTLDEYYNYTPSDSFDFEALYAELINYKPPITPTDLDGDGIPNHLDDDIDGDGIPNAIDDDIDGDNIPNELDDDMDGDGIPNAIDDDMDGDRIPNREDDDIDGDGIPNNEDDDMDGDGIPNNEDDDMDGDGIPNNEDDDMDGDGIPNGQDLDVDGDSVLNEYDLDINGDGIPNDQDSDMDSDGIPNEEDDDMDGDGILNINDEDMNGNGIHDFKEAPPKKDNEIPFEESPTEGEATEENSEEDPIEEDPNEGIEEDPENGAIEENPEEGTIVDDPEEVIVDVPDEGNTKNDDTDDINIEE